MKEKKRASILNVASIVFAEKGFHAATIEEIASRAGIGKGTVYEYFQSKEELFQEILKKGMADYFATLRERLKESDPAREILIEIARSHIRFLVEQRALGRIITSEPGCSAVFLRDWLREIQERKHAVIKKLISRGIRDGEFRPVDPGIAADIFSGVVSALCIPLLHSHLQHEDGDAYNEADLEERLREGLDIFFRGLESSSFH